MVPLPGCAGACNSSLIALTGKTPPFAAETRDLSQFRTRSTPSPPSLDVFPQRFLFPDDDPLFPPRVERGGGCIYKMGHTPRVGADERRGGSSFLIDDSIRSVAD